MGTPHSEHMLQESVNLPFFNRHVAQVPVNASNRTTWVYGGTKDPHTAMLGGHSTLNTVVLGEGMSKYQIPPSLRPPYICSCGASGPLLGLC
jgi:hypothetical protein